MASFGLWCLTCVSTLSMNRTLCDAWPLLASPGLLACLLARCVFCSPCPFMFCIGLFVAGLFLVCVSVCLRDCMLVCVLVCLHVCLFCVVFFVYFVCLFVWLVGDRHQKETH